MGHGGKRAGSGRKPGAVARFSSARLERAIQEGKRLPPEQLLGLAEEAMAMVERYRPIAGKKPNEERYAFWMGQAGEFLKAAAPYYAPKLHVLAGEVRHKSEISISQVLNTTMTPQEAMQAYIKMIDAKPL
jgi:hypothetical protein